ncbi:MAG TPA: glycosyltransferase, partial [Mucilaginibacter sp.]|nr:glycosyltransferase [Mucilaginibacter sp.]
MFQPKLSVITVVFNDVKHIGRTLRSVLGQTYPNIEYIIIDGLSADGTLDVIGPFRDRIRLISERDEGIYDAMNKGLS